VSQATYTPLPDGGGGPGPGIDAGTPAPAPTQLTVTVSGLAGGGLTVANGNDTLPIHGNGTFPFATPVPHGASFDVEIKAQPTQPSQVCTVIAGAGTADQDTIDVGITCATSTFGISGTVMNLLGTGLQLSDNGTESLPITGNGAFAFTTPVASGAAFAVTVTQQPINPSQTCSVAGGTGTVGAADVTGVVVNCAVDQFTIGGTVTGLLDKVTLLNNGQPLTVNANGTFAFPTTVVSGGTYDVTVQTPPASPVQSCTVAGGSGTVGGQNINNITVTCTTTLFHISGTLTGLAAGDQITLLDNGTDALTLSAADSTFTFNIALPSDHLYSITVQSSPTAPIAQQCTVTNASGPVGPHDITNVAVSCSTDSFSLGGTITGLTGIGGLVLQLNGATQLPLNTDGTFSLASLPSGTGYTVTIANQPLRTNCTLANPTGTIGASNVTNLQITCGPVTWSTALFPLSIPGASSGLGDLDFDKRGDLLVTVSGASKIERVNHATGAITTVATLPAAQFILGVVYRPSTDTIYASDSNGNIWAIAADGTSHSIANIPTPNGITIAPASFGSFGGFIIVTSLANGMFAVNPDTGATTNFAMPPNPGSDVVFGPDGTLYTCGNTSVSTVTPAGVVTPFVTGFGSADGIAITADGTKLFVADSGTQSVVSVALPSKVKTTVGPAAIQTGAGVGGIVAAPGGALIVMTGNTSLTLVAFPF
jgi:hypothetical protein